MAFSWNLPKQLLLIWRCYDVFYVCLLRCIKLYSLEVALCKISGLKHKKISKLLIHEPLTIFLNHPVYWVDISWFYIYWVDISWFYIFWVDISLFYIYWVDISLFYIYWPLYILILIDIILFRTKKFEFYLHIIVFDIHCIFNFLGSIYIYSISLYSIYIE